MSRSMLLLFCLCLPLLGNAVTVENPSGPRDGIEHLVLEPVWRHGGLDDEEAFFGVIDAVAAGTDGETYLADAQLMTVHVVAPDGELVGTLGRQGEGPGEVTRLGGVVPLADGSIGLVQLTPGQVVKVGRDGLPVGTVVPRWPEAGGRLMLQDLRRTGDQLFAAGRRAVRGERGPEFDQWIAALGPSGEIEHFYWRASAGRDLAAGVLREADSDWPGQGRWTVTSGGQVIIAPERNAYRLQVFGREGLEREFSRSYTSRPRTDDEKAAVEARFTQFRRGRGGRRPAGLTVEVLPTAPDVVALIARPDGELWVQTSRSHLDQPDGVMLTYDVFDAAGNFIRQLSVACEGVAPRDALHPLSNGTFVLVKGHADAVAAMRGVETDETIAEDVVLEVVGLRPAAR